MPRKIINKVKYTAVDKKTYATDTYGLEFNIVINNINATGFWRKTGSYNPGGVDVNEVRLETGEHVTIFSNGGTYRSYEIKGAPQIRAKQPKNLRFTGPYFDTKNLGKVFTDKIKAGIAKSIDAKLSDNFIKAFNIE